MTWNIKEKKNNNVIKIASDNDAILTVFAGYCLKIVLRSKTIITVAITVTK